ncbi:aldehyde dehydrogenase [Psychrobacter sp. AOP7-A1-24]|uniref:aldehyde dehydrogenase n=1 Tax=Psychrobacter sp. AOP7-A1-24 TaxID=3457646 RepID=UPI00402B6E8E
MSDLLTLEEYTKIADNLSLQTQAFIDGSFQDAKSGKTFDTTNPATGDLITKIAACGQEDVDMAVASAKEAFEDGRWCKQSPNDRKKVLLEFADLIEENIIELAVMESVDSGKPVSECQLTDLPEAIHTIRWHAELIDKIYDNTAPLNDDSVAMIVREPIGVVGLVLPWNFPLLMLAWKIGPALASGCSIVVKPAKETTLTTLKVAELAKQAGLPDGVLNIVSGSGKEAGEPLGLHMDVDMISFTGSTQTGKLFLRYAADSNLKRIVLECGGKNPAVVFKDVENLDNVAAHIVNGAFWNMGENCSASSRLIVHQDIKDELLTLIGKHMSEWQTGNPLDPNNQIGSLVSDSHFEKVKSYVEIARQGEHHIQFGGKAENNFVEPTVVDNVSATSQLFQEEIFGPVLVVTTFAEDNEALELANDTIYGLTGAVYSDNIKKAIKAARAIRAGVVTINCFGEGDITTPFGGYKESGFGGRDKSAWAHDQYTELKTIWIDLNDD